MEYKPRCKYCGTVNKLNLNEPINYIYTTFNCRICRFHNMNKIRLIRKKRELLFFY